MKRPATKKNLIYIQTAISKPHVNGKLKIYNRYTHKKEKGNTTLRLGIKSQEKRTKDEEKKRGLPKQIQNN